MKQTLLIVPGYHGSGPSHWQTWLENQLPEARRVGGIDWESPVLAHWTAEIHREIDKSPSELWIVAHSFGCLASVVAASQRPEKIAGLMLVAPANPKRFAPFGPRGDGPGNRIGSIAPRLPDKPLDLMSTLVASTNDPWLSWDAAETWAERWGSRLVNVGLAGHINAEAGYGPWPLGFSLLRSMQRAYDNLPRDKLGSPPVSPQNDHDPRFTFYF
ncbi:MAG: alpha/beta hydrolase [Methylohalobius crimeensis]